MMMYNEKTKETFIATLNHIDVFDDNLTKITHTYYVGNGQYKIINNMVFNSDCSKFISCADDTIQLWCAESKQCIQTFPAIPAIDCRIRSIALFKNNDYFLTGDDNHKIKLWSITKGKCLHTYYGHSSYVKSVILFDNDTKFISGSLDKEMKVWCLKTNECIQTIKCPDPDKDCIGITSLALFDNDSKILVGCTCGSIKIWCFEEKKFIQKFKNHNDCIDHILLIDDNQFIAASSSTGVINRWNIETGECTYTHKINCPRFRAIVLFDNNTKLLISYDYFTLEIFCLKTEKILDRTTYGKLEN